MKLSYKIILMSALLFPLHVLALSTPDSLATEIQTRYLKPPQLNAHNWGQQVLCHRPMRRGAPRMGIEKIGEKIVVHNYGHGGSGWTLAPGCAHYLTTQFEQLTQNRETPIAIIGAGVLGLFTAYELVQAGYTNITLIAEQYDNLTSHKAGGFLAPSTMDVDPDMQSVIDEICFDAYRFYAEIARGENRDFPAGGALIMSIYLKRGDDRLQPYEGIVMNKPQDVIIDFGNGTQYEMQVYDDGIFMDTGIMMNALTTFLQNNVQWVQHRVDSFDEIDAPCIFNCAGLGARQINQDDAMVSVQGHLILLEDQNPADMDYMISFHAEYGITHDGIPVKRSIYMFPKHIPGSPERSIGVMGGTFIEGATAQIPHKQEFDLIIKRAREFFCA